MKNSHKQLLSRRLLSLALCYALLAMATIHAIGCNTDTVIDTLMVADGVAQKAIPIISPVNQEVATVLSRVDADIQLVVKVYGEYESAASEDKPSKAQLIQATASAIKNNLAEILTAVGVKNPQLLAYIQVAVAVINSALEVVLGKLSPPSPVVQAPQAGQVKQQLPTIQNAKSAKDLKNAWNNAVKLAYPQSVLP